MAHIREVRPHARELKFLVAPDVAVKIRRWARTHLEPDANGLGPFGDEYHTTSVYYDTAAYDVFHRRGSFGRSKYRIRRYGDEQTVFLERKMRQPAVLAKRRTSLALASLSRLTEPALDADWPGYWFHRRVMARRLQPVCEVAYSRMARGVLRNGEQVRLTLDCDLRAMPAGEDTLFASGRCPCPGSAGLILELKYRGAPPAIFRQLVEEFALTPQMASKYRLGVVALGLAPCRTKARRAPAPQRSMPEFLRRRSAGAVEPLAVLGRLVAAMLLGVVVAWIYKRTRPASDTSSSLAVTLVLLSILIAMVTQVIGDNVARAFSLVGALSIVRFRTVVRDTVDTAFVIFAVAVGMAVGASHASVALSGIVIVGVAAWFMTRGQRAAEMRRRTFCRCALASDTTWTPCSARRSAPTSASAGWSRWRPRSKAWRSKCPTASSSAPSSRPSSS